MTIADIYSLPQFTLPDSETQAPEMCTSCINSTLSLTLFVASYARFKNTSFFVTDEFFSNFTLLRLKILCP